MAYSAYAVSKVSKVSKSSAQFLLCLDERSHQVRYVTYATVTITQIMSFQKRKYDNLIPKKEPECPTKRTKKS